MMALEAVCVSDVTNLDHVNEKVSVSLQSTRFSTGAEAEAKQTTSYMISKFLVVGHRGKGMNQLQSPDKRMRAIKENSILSFNAAAKFPIDFIEFDVQVTKDDCPIIFHDNFILSEENGTIFERRVTELSLPEFLSYGPQTDAIKVGKTLMRKTNDGKIMKWDVESDDALCTLQQALENVEPLLGFNIELKFDDHVVYEQDDLFRALQPILQVVYKHARDRPVIFSSFQPDAALLMRKLQSSYAVFFLTNGGTELHCDIRRNSLEEAVKVCLEGGLQGIVSEVKGVFRNPGVVTKIKESNLSLLTYGKLNNVAEAVYLQHQMGIEGVIVDLVQEISLTVREMVKPCLPATAKEEEMEGSLKPQFSKKELAFLFNLIPELICH